MSAPERQGRTPKKQVEFSGSDGGPGGRKPTAVGTGDDGQDNWLSRIIYITSSLTGEASRELQNLLSEIAKRPGVIGTVIVGHDGLLMASIVPADVDAISVGVWALGVYMNSEHVIRRMGIDRVHQILSVTSSGCVSIADFGGGLLVVVSDRGDLDSLIAIMSGDGVAA